MGIETIVGGALGLLGAHEEGRQQKKAQGRLDAREQEIRDLFQGLFPQVEGSYGDYRKYLEEALSNILNFSSLEQGALTGAYGDLQGGFSGARGAVTEGASSAREALSAGSDRARGEAQSVGEGSREQIMQQAAAMQGQASEAAMAQGLLGSTYAGNLQRGVMGDVNRAMVDLDSQLAGLFANISQQEGQGLASIYGQEGAALSDLFTREGQGLADIQMQRGNAYARQGAATSALSQAMGASFVDELTFNSKLTSDLSSFLSGVPVSGGGPSLLSGALAGGLSGLLFASGGTDSSNNASSSPTYVPGWGMPPWKP